MLPALLFASSSKEEGAQRLDAAARHRHCAQRKRHGSPSGAALQRDHKATGPQKEGFLRQRLIQTWQGGSKAYVAA